ncbi:related to nonribosomal peptide synthetase MxcG (component of the myxochelin iron transport regulon) [Cephalotrichum gorgonifer]|uniref:Related to nonribosomal peptide synthetase MxcG (Component of the myxochelin iron transport regulon) n=1 Tax=Cephalotrichum gorgonifer TaxID=2041049 RepID=A0AAE8N652_9PEZI|nr:related to nonribosomal peptide synthetase MxcG (component of the myxochelin iron transport regulon) [Cephalotrichum gorgonifer]
MAGASSVKPAYGRRLMIDIIDGHAMNNPSRTWLLTPRSSDPADGWKPVTFKDGSKAIDRIAHKIIETSGHPPSGEFPTIAYIGPNDIRYIIFMFGAIKAGYQALFISPRNSHEGQMNLFHRTNCNTICFDFSFRKVVQPLLQERDMLSIMASPVDQWFPQEEVPHFPYEKSFDQARWEPFTVLHTSGSTGLPKPIICRQGMISISDAYHHLPEWHGTKICMQAWADKGSVLLDLMPLFHAAGLYLTITMTLFWDMVVALAIPEKPLSSDLTLECLTSLKPDSVMMPPVILEDISQSKESMNVLSKLNFVAFGGGSLAPKAGDELVRNGVTLENIISSTEFAPFPVYMQPGRTMWQWFIINSEVFGCEWRNTDAGPDIFEQVIVRKAKDPGLQGFFYTFPDLDEFHTKDLFRKHPTLSDHWFYHGRSDDVIVFSNGEKLNPVTIESIIMGHPDLHGALVVGTNRFQPALLLEPKEPLKTEDEENKLVDSVWPLVVRANKETVAHGQIGRKFIRVTKPEKPFLRASKGTIQRAGTVKMYSEYIDQLYEKAGQTSASDAIPVDISSENGMVESVAKIFAVVEGVDAPPDPDTDFFQSGVDSMQVISASRLLRASLESAGVHTSADALATRVIYGNPTPRKLAHYLFSLVKSGLEGEETAAEHEISAMRTQVERYTRSLPAKIQGKQPPSDDAQTILLTGSTGGLGSYLLDFMCSSPTVKKVICLNRVENGRERQTQVSSGRGLRTDFHKVEFLHADLSKGTLGLDYKEDYGRLKNEVDRIIHNQWPVNFNLSVESFEPHIRGVRHLVDFSASAKKAVPITFISSIGAVDGWKEPHPVPESSIGDMTISSTGYGRSKLVSSLILEKATEESGVPTEIIRVGQIAGPLAKQGVWNRQEWLPSIIASSVYLGSLPGDLGAMETVDWTPIEAIAQMVLEVSGITSRVSLPDVSGYFHGVNPSTTTWGQLAPAVKDFYGGRLKSLVPFAQWVQELDQSQTASDDVNKNPAVKLLDTYRGMSAGSGHVDMDMKRTKKYSRTMRELGPISPELMKHWCGQWGF